MSPRRSPASFRLWPRLLTILGVAALGNVGLPAALPGPWVEPDFPFFSSSLDARKVRGVARADNLSPRGLVLNLGHECWAAFDPDLLRLAAIWRGPGVTAKALAPGSYHDVSVKPPGGQGQLPKPDGDLWLANGIYPGWQTGDRLALTDPRSPAPSPEEVGRGPLDVALGRFNAIHFAGTAAILDYTVAGTAISETLRAHAATGPTASPVVERLFAVAAGEKPLRLVVGFMLPAARPTLFDATEGITLAQQDGVWTVLVPASTAARRFGLAFAPTGSAQPTGASAALPTGAPARRWPQDVTSTVTLATGPEAYVVDTIDLPQENPWQRSLRPADIQFRRDGTGVLVTIDGDVWLVRGLGAAQQTGATVRWHRFASGLHEPMNVALRDDEIFVFDRNGVWHLRDTNADGEADVHALFANNFGQTADLREFPSGIRLAPGGEFVIAKGGQQALTQGKHNGSVLRLSADGLRTTVLGYGFRQPNIAVHPRTGLVTSSDQQGNYVPATPLHLVRDGQFYGFLAPFAPKERYPSPPADPLTWIPHPVNASAMSQVWLLDAKMGPLNDGLVHIGFNQPELFRVLLNDRSRQPQAAVVSITRAFPFTPLHGSVNPADGQLYLAGFQVLGWGNVIDTAAGFGRVRYTGAPVVLPREIVPTDRGVLLRFGVPLDPKAAADPASYSLQSWAYRRSFNYGSAQYKADGTAGQDALNPSAAYVSTDRRAVFIAVPTMKPVMQLRVGWALNTAAGAAFSANAYTTPYALPPFDPVAEGFGVIAIDLTPRAATAVAAAAPATAETGRQLAQLFACVACHADDTNATVAKSGPTWRGLFGRTDRPVFVDGQSRKVAVNEAYVRESILTPTAKIAAGYEKGEYAMPSYAGVLNDSQIESLVLYIRSLR